MPIRVTSGYTVRYFGLCRGLTRRYQRASDVRGGHPADARHGRRGAHAHVPQHGRKELGRPDVHARERHRHSRLTQHVQRRANIRKICKYQNMGQYVNFQQKRANQQTNEEPPNRQMTLEQRQNVVEIKSLRCSKLNCDVVQTLSARWAEIH